MKAINVRWEAKQMNEVTGIGPDVPVEINNIIKAGMASMILLGVSAAEQQGAAIINELNSLFI